MNRSAFLLQRIELNNYLVLTFLALTNCYCLGNVAQAQQTPKTIPYPNQPNNPNQPTPNLEIP